MSCAGRRKSGPSARQARVSGHDSDVIAAVLGTDLVPPVVAFGQGYANGAVYVNSSVDVLITYHPGGLDVAFTDPEWGAATAAQASGGTNSACPPDDVPCPPGNCTEWVASNTTGQPVRAMIGRLRMSETSML